jgi:hypothetical protein
MNQPLRTLANTNYAICGQMRPKQFTTPIAGFQKPSHIILRNPSVCFVCFAFHLNTTLQCLNHPHIIQKTSRSLQSTNVKKSKKSNSNDIVDGCFFLLVEHCLGICLFIIFLYIALCLFAWTKMVALDKINTTTLDTNNQPLRKTIMATIKDKTITPLVITLMATADPLDMMTARRTVTTVDAHTVMTGHRLVVKNPKVKK